MAFAISTVDTARRIIVTMRFVAQELIEGWISSEETRDGGCLGVMGTKG